MNKQFEIGPVKPVTGDIVNESPEQKIIRMESVLRAAIPALWMLKSYFETVSCHDEGDQMNARGLSEELEKTARKFEDHLYK